MFSSCEITVKLTKQRRCLLVIYMTLFKSYWSRGNLTELQNFGRISSKRARWHLFFSKRVLLSPFKIFAVLN